MRYFAFLYVEDEKVSALLNTAIAVLNPKAKWPAHVTVAGPFSSRRNLPRKLTYRRTMLVLGIGQFRSDTQNTVYLRVGAQGLRKLSSKTDYDYNPHITLYDGLDHALGDKLYDRLSKSFRFANFYVSNLRLVEAGRAQRDMDFLLNQLDDGLLRELNVNLSAIDSFSIEERIDVATIAVREALAASRFPGEVEA